MPDHQAEIEKLWRMIKGLDVVMMTTFDESGILRSRPMATQQVEFNGELWFFSRDPSPKLSEIRKESHVNLSYVDRSKSHFVSVSGRASVIRDLEKARQLWTSPLKAWFPLGLEDPELSLIRVHVDQAEYWDAPSSKMIKLLSIARSLAKGQRPYPEGHQKLDLGA
jgi:general stress protein 26